MNVFLCLLKRLMGVDQNYCYCLKYENHAWKALINDPNNGDQKKPGDNESN